MANQPRPPTELLEKLEAQKRALAASGRAYDAGEKWEAERLATTAYILLHDGGQRALLSQLGLRREMLFVSSSRGLRQEHMLPNTQDAGEIIPPTPLLIIELNTVAIFHPMCAVEMPIHWHRWLKFSKWYEEPIFKTSRGRTLSRKNLIFALRNQDGGAHVDSMLKDEEYSSLKYDPDPRVRTNGAPMPNAHYASMRQIAWEIETSLVANRPIRSNSDPI